MYIVHTNYCFVKGPYQKSLAWALRLARLLPAPPLAPMGPISRPSGLQNCPNLSNSPRPRSPQRGDTCGRGEFALLRIARRSFEADKFLILYNWAHRPKSSAFWAGSPSGWACSFSRLSDRPADLFALPAGERGERQRAVDRRSAAAGSGAGTHAPRSYSDRRHRPISLGSPFVKAEKIFLRKIFSGFGLDKCRAACWPVIADRLTKARDQRAAVGRTAIIARRHASGSVPVILPRDLQKPARTFVRDASTNLDTIQT